MINPSLFRTNVATQQAGNDIEVRSSKSGRCCVGVDAPLPISANTASLRKRDDFWECCEIETDQLAEFGPIGRISVCSVRAQIAFAGARDELSARSGCNVAEWLQNDHIAIEP